MVAALDTVASAVASILSTPCYDLLPPFVQTYFVSHAFIPNPATNSIPLGGALLPPSTYFIALFFLSSPHPRLPTVLAKYLLAALSAVAFFTLPFYYHVPGSAIFTYQLGLIGCFGSARVIDIFFLSAPRVPRRITIPQRGMKIDGTLQGYLRKPEMGHEDTREGRDGRVYPHTDNLTWQWEVPPRTLFERLWWSLDLMISMRGIGWDFASADVRHDVSPWQPPSRRQLKSASLKMVPALTASIVIIHLLVAAYLPYTALADQDVQESSAGLQTRPSILDIPPTLRPLMVLATGIALYTLFDCGYTLVSAVILPLLRGIATASDTSMHNVDFFPLLNPVKLTEICSVRSFWSKAWHRLFHRAWLVFGILPMTNLALLLAPRDGANLLSPRSHPDPGRLLPKGTHDWAKVLGAFAASGMVHCISERAALGGRIALPANNLWLEAGFGAHHTGAPSLRSTLGLASKEEISGRFSVTRIVPPFSGAGEMTFFVLNGLAVLLEGAFYMWIRKQRKAQALTKKKALLSEQLQQLTGSSSTVLQLPSDSARSNLRPSRAISRDQQKRLEGEDEEISSDGTATPSGGAIKRSGSPHLAHGEQDRYVQLEISEEDLVRPYDRYVGLIWAVTVLLTSGEAFVEGWIKSGVMAELTFAPH